MRSKPVRLFAIASTVLLTLCVLTGCRTDNKKGLLEDKNYVVDIEKLTAKKQPMKEDESDLEWRSDTSEFSFKMWIGIPSIRETIGNINTLVGQEVSRLTGAKWEVEIPSSNESTVMQMMVAANNYPDVVVCPLNWPSLNSMVKGGKALALSDLIDKYCPKMWNLIDESAMKWYTFSDGKMYYMPSYIADTEEVNNSSQKSNQPNFYVRRDIYDKMGRPDMSTPETFISTLKKVKEEYPDLIPLDMGFIYLTDYSLSPTIKILLTGFGVQPQGGGADQPVFVYKQGDNIQLPFRDPNYKRGLKFINSLHRQGIIDDSSLIQRQSQIDQRLNNAEYFCTAGYASSIHNELNKSLAANLSPDIQYEMINPPFAEEGVTPKYPNLKSKGWMTAVITNNAKQPERLIKFFEFLFSNEGQRTILLGKEGVTYSFVDSRPTLKDNVIQYLLENNTAELNKLGLGSTFAFAVRGRYVEPYSRAQLLGKRPELESDYQKMSKYAVDLFELGLGDIGPRMGSNEYLTYSRVMEQFMRNMLKMLSAKSDEEFEKLYSEGVESAEKAGAGQVEQYLTQNHRFELQQINQGK